MGALGGEREKCLPFLMLDTKGSACLQMSSAGKTKNSLWWFSYQQSCHICVFLLYFSNPPCLLADAPLHSCSVAGLPEREDGPFSLDLKLATLCCNPHQKIYSSLVLGVWDKRLGYRLRQLLRQAGKQWVSSGRGARRVQGTECCVWSCLVEGTTDFRACPRKFCGEASSSCDSFQFESSARPDKESATGGGVLGLNMIYTVGSLSPPPTFL